ncbi:MAG: hypothetical protein HYT87_04215 [Nitrospirae bacterium]|nr:hypothetical protein [Nitrospirota bacterium]
MTLLRLHLPGWYAFWNAARRPTRDSKIKAVALLLGASGFWAAIFFSFLRLLRHFQSTELVGDILISKLLMMMTLLFLALLLYSSVVVAVSTLLLSKDLELLQALPVPSEALFQKKFLETLLHSSWMFLLFALPIFYAYAFLYRAGPAFYPALGAGLLAFLVIPAAVAVAIILLLGLAFPARRTRDAAFVGSISLFAALYLVIRFMRPEKLVDPSSFKSMMGYIASLRAPSSPWLPSTWLAHSILDSLAGRWDEVAFYLGLLVTTAASLFILISAVMRRAYPTLLSKAQETRRSTPTNTRKGQAILGRLLRPLPRPLGSVVYKEIRTFFRDPSQWSQIILIGALIVAYLYNFHALPRERFPISQFALETIVSFLNLGLCGFVMAAMAARFVFPLISLEGRAFWLLRTAPVSARHLFAAKFFVGFVPLTALGLVLTVASNVILGSSRFMHLLSATTTFLSGIAIVALALCFGTLYPRFHVENPARISTGFGGLMYMIASMLLLALVAALEAWPVYLYYLSQFKGWTIQTHQWLGMGASFAAALALLVATTTLSLRLGIRRLGTLEP